jgi:hypothetical protein
MFKFLTLFPNGENELLSGYIGSCVITLYCANAIEWQKVEMETDVYLNVRFLAIFLRLQINKIHNLLYIFITFYLILIL